MTSAEEIEPLAKAKRMERDAKRAVDRGDPARPPEFSDEAIALYFAAQHADDLRHVAAWGRWLHWTGARWRQDDTLLAYDLVRAVTREIASRCNEMPIAKAIASAKTVAAVERMAKADRRHAATVDQWDADLWLLNTPGGIVDLRTGDLREHRPGDFMTKICAVTPAGRCPAWMAFLAKVTAGDTELQRFLQRVAGYALTGSTSAHALFFAYGTGANGKSVFLNTLAGILGEYATSAPMETFVASNSERHPTDLAGLRGARLVTAIETEEGRRWAESKIKALTGGDKISARFMRMDYFEFAPRFKLVIAGNHRPGLRNVDEAIRRRMNLIPFVVTIPPDERDEDLAEKLKAEWPGILAWMIDGCLDWQTEGLAQPEAVRDATKEYLEAEDAMATWIAERCSVKPGFATTSAALYADWKGWTDKAGEYAGSMKRFSQALATGRGLTKDRLGAQQLAGFRGIGLKAPAAAPADQDPRDD